MIILSQSGEKMTDWGKVKKVYQLGENVMIGYGDKDYDSFGKYRTKNQANLAIGKLYYDLSEGKTSFQFPQMTELPDSKAHYGAGGGKRHGGS